MSKTKYVTHNYCYICKSKKFKTINKLLEINTTIGFINTIVFEITCDNCGQTTYGNNNTAEISIIYREYIYDYIKKVRGII